MKHYAANWQPMLTVSVVQTVACLAADTNHSKDRFSLTRNLWNLFGFYLYPCNQVVRG